MSKSKDFTKDMEEHSQDSNNTITYGKGQMSDAMAQQLLDEHQKMSTDEIKKKAINDLRYELESWRDKYHVTQAALEDIQVSIEGAIVESNGEFEIKGKDVIFGVNGLDLPEGAGFDFDLMDYVGHILFSLEENVQLWIGDWLVQHEARIPDEYKGNTESIMMKLIEEIAIEYEREPDTLYRYYSVCKSIPKRMRVRGLSYNHYRMIARFKNDEAKSEWIKRAQENEWSYRELGLQINPPAPVGEIETFYNGLNFFKKKVFEFVNGKGKNDKSGLVDWLRQLADQIESGNTK